MQTYVSTLSPDCVNKDIDIDSRPYSFEHICNLMTVYNCVLCFKEIEKDYERYLVKSRKKTMFDVSVAPRNLDFYIHVFSEYICKPCLGLLKKLENLEQNLEDLKNSIRNNYATSLEKERLVFHPKGSLLHSPNFSGSGEAPKKRRLEEARKSLIQLGNVPFSPFSSPVMSSTPKKQVDFQAIEKPSSTSVHVWIEWPSNSMDRKVPQQLESLSKMLVRCTYKLIANAAWWSPNLKKELQLIVLKEINKECTSMC